MRMPLSLTAACAAILGLAMSGMQYEARAFDGVSDVGTTDLAVTAPDGDVFDDIEAAAAGKPKPKQPPQQPPKSAQYCVKWSFELMYDAGGKPVSATCKAVMANPYAQVTKTVQCTNIHDCRQYCAATLGCGMSSGSSTPVF